MCESILHFFFLLFFKIGGAYPKTGRIVSLVQDSVGVGQLEVVSIRPYHKNAAQIPLIDALFCQSRGVYSTFGVIPELIPSQCG